MTDLDFQIFVKSLSGVTVTLDVKKGDTIRRVKQLAHEKTGVGVSEMRMIFAGRELLEIHQGKVMTIDDYDITKENVINTLHMVVRLRGGQGDDNEVSVVTFKVEFGSKTYEITVESTKTIGELKRIMHEKAEMPVTSIKLEFPIGTILRNGHSIEFYKITNNSEILMEKSLDIASGVTLSNLADMFTSSQDEDDPRALMSCSHAATPTNLTTHCLSLLDERKFEFRCPHIDRSKSEDDPNRICNKLWSWKEVRKNAVLTQEEIKEFTKRMSMNFMSFKSTEITKCPKCPSYLFRDGTRYVRVTCPNTSCNFEFCYECKKQWRGSGMTECGNYECSAEYTHDQLKLLQDKKVTIGYINKESFEFRACVWCGTWISFVSDCKHMRCQGCNREFCFYCLKKKVGSRWLCGAHDTVCPYGMAPLQSVSDLRRIKAEWRA